MKSMNAVLTAAVGSELVSSLQGTLLQLKVRRQFRRGHTGDYASRLQGSRLDARGDARAAREQKALKAC